MNNDNLRRTCDAVWEMMRTLRDCADAMSNHEVNFMAFALVDLVSPHTDMDNSTRERVLDCLYLALLDRIGRLTF